MCPTRPLEVFVAVRFLLRYNEPHLASRRNIMIRVLTTKFVLLAAFVAVLSYPGQAQAQDKKVEDKKVDPKTDPKDDKSAEPSKDLLVELKSYRHKIVYETNRDGNWELYICNADGTNHVNLTNTKDVDELYPKPSPDGTKICFCADSGPPEARRRDI